MKFTVGGREIDLTLEQVAHALQGVEPEPIQEHLVELNGTVYPPKQVFAIVTGWPRRTFTTMEAQRVLSRLGLICRRAGRSAWVRQDDELDAASAIVERLGIVEAALVTAQTAIAGLSARVAALEAG